MKTTHALSIAAGALLLGSTLALAAEGLEVGKGDSVADVIGKHTGKVVTLRVKDGDDLTGTVAQVGDKSVHLKELSGKEFFDAVVSLESVTAVVVRARGR